VTKAIELGDRVKYRISGFVGVVTAQTDYLNGCRRFCVQSEKDGKDGKVGPEEWFDEQSLTVVNKRVHPLATLRPQPMTYARTGGPARSGDRSQR
jgi:hypothetical protein